MPAEIESTPFPPIGSKRSQRKVVSYPMSIHHGHRSRRVISACRATVVLQPFGESDMLLPMFSAKQEGAFCDGFLFGQLVHIRATRYRFQARMRKNTRS